MVAMLLPNARFLRPAGVDLLIAGWYEPDILPWPLAFSFSFHSAIQCHLCGQQTFWNVDFIFPTGWRFSHRKCCSAQQVQLKRDFDIFYFYLVHQMVHQSFIVFIVHLLYIKAYCTRCSPRHGVFAPLHS